MRLTDFCAAMWRRILSQRTGKNSPQEPLKATIAWAAKMRLCHSDTNAAMQRRSCGRFKALYGASDSLPVRCETIRRRPWTL